MGDDHRDSEGYYLEFRIAYVVLHTIRGTLQIRRVQRGP